MDKPPVFGGVARATAWRRVLGAFAFLMKFEKAYREILARQSNSDRQPKLARVREVLHRLGDPDASFKSVVIAGTNGKTSTARILEGILRHSGFKTGLFTSPHLLSPTERIAINGNPISKKQFADIYARVIPIVEEYEAELAQTEGETFALSFFELLTVMAFAEFAAETVHFAVVEVGLGGRFDAVNVLHSDACIITPIDYDHEEYLGAELTLIAAQKAGVMQNAQTVILAKQPQMVEAVLLDEAERREKQAIIPTVLGKPDAFVAPDGSKTGQFIDIATPRGEYLGVYLNLLGSHQASNAALALSAAEELIAPHNQMLAREVIEEAFEAVTSPGRMQILSRNPLIVLDISHNAQGVHTLLDTLKSSLEIKQIIAVIGILQDKNAQKMFELYEDFIDFVVVAKNSSARSYSAQDLEEIALNYYNSDDVYRYDNVAQAVDFAQNFLNDYDEPGTALLITGSVITAADALQFLQSVRAEIDAQTDADAEIGDAEV